MNQPMQPASSTPVVPMAQPTINPGAPFETMMPEKSAGKPKMIFLLTLIVIVAGLALGGAVILMGQNSEEDKNEDETADDGGNSNDDGEKPDSSPVDSFPVDGGLGDEPRDFVELEAIKTLTAKAGEFSITSKFVGSNKWEYLVTGYKPTPCHELKVDALVAESFPEQVSINIEITAPTAGTACIEVIEEFNHRGSYSASEGATLSGKVVNK